MAYSTSIFTNANLQTFLIFTIVTILIIWLMKKPKYHSHLPPRPFQWPIVGCLPGLAWSLYRSGVPPFELFARKAYGKIFCLSLGSRLVVVMNDHEHIREAFLKPDLSGRPRFAEQDKENTGNLLNTSTKVT